MINLRERIKHLSNDIFINDNPIILDIGAHVGKYTEIFAKCKCQVYAFEPTKKIFNILKNKCITYKNVECINKAVWIEKTTLKLYEHELSKKDKNEVKLSQSNSLLFEKTNVRKDYYQEIETENLSEFIFNFDKNIDFIKMDIEGAEIEVLNHLIDTGAIKNINYIICETHEKKNEFLKEPTELLKKRIIDEGLSHKIDLSWI